jgi:hypothetical protein
MIKISERDIAPEKQFQKLFRIISEDISGDYLKQVLITPYGKHIRYLDPTTRKQVKVDPHSFNLGYKSSLKNKNIKISSRDKVLINAVVLDEASVRELNSRYPGIYPNHFSHHMTIDFGKDYYPDNLGQEVTMTVDGYAKDDNAEAVHISGANSDNANPHITISTNSGIKPSYSNQLMANGYEKIQPFMLKGIVSSYTNGKYVSRQ